MFESLAWVSSKLLKVTEAEARSQQLLHLMMIMIILPNDVTMMMIIMMTMITMMMIMYPVHPSSQVASQPMCQRENTATMSCKSYLYACKETHKMLIFEK